MMPNINSILGLIPQLRRQNPDALINQLEQNNPQFKQFIDANKGKSVEQIASDYGIDINSLKWLLKM
jgi:hypothetical protein